MILSKNIINNCHKPEQTIRVAKIGAEGLWKYVIHRLEKLGPFDYSREVSMPPHEIFYPKPVAELLSCIKGYVDSKLSKEEEEIQSELENVDELTDVEEKEKEIEKRLDPRLTEDDTMKKIVSELLKMLPPAQKQDRK